MSKSKSFYRSAGIKIFSLLIAVIVWFYINGIVQKISGGPIEYKDLKDVEIKLMGGSLFLGRNLFVVELENKSIDLRVKGPKQEIEKLTPLNITAYVNLSGLKAGRTYSPVVNFIFPQNIKMVGSPPLVRVEIKDENL